MVDDRAGDYGAREMVSKVVRSPLSVVDSSRAAALEWLKSRINYEWSALSAL